MAKLIVFNSVSLDGYFAGTNGDLSWAHSPDAEWQGFVEKNAKGGGLLLFGRKTYELMASYWPTPPAIKAFPVVAERMNSRPKFVFSRTLDKPAWNNTTLLKGDLATEVRKLKRDSGRDIVILGSGSIVSQLAQEGLIDEYQIAVCPVVLGKGRTMFEGVKDPLPLKLEKTRSFRNGNIMLFYQPS